jgi:hydroxymethylbilane synthase
MLHERPDLGVVLLRGNVPTRLRCVLGGEVPATLLAMADLARSRLFFPRPRDSRPPAGSRPHGPAAGRGVTAVTVREGDTLLRGLLARAEDAEPRLAATAERASRAEMNGPCCTPIGGHTEAFRTCRLRLTGLVARTGRSF